MKNNLTIEKNLTYKELIPIDDLSKYVQCFWSMENISKDETITVLPDGCFDIVIYIYKNKNDIKITGIWNKPIKVKKYKGVDIVGVRFYPSALDIFFNINVADRINLGLKPVSERRQVLSEWPMLFLKRKPLKFTPFVIMDAKGCTIRRFAEK